MHAILDLSILFDLKGHLLHSPLLLPHDLLLFRLSVLLSVQLHFQFLDPQFQLLDRLLVAVQSRSLGLVKAQLEFLELRFEGPSKLLDLVGVVLFVVQFVGHASRIGLRLPRQLLRDPQRVRLILVFNLKERTENQVR